MKSSPMTVRALLAALATLGAVITSSHAQSVTTAPVGAVTKTVPVGLSSIGITLLNSDVVVASCSSNTTGALTLSGVTNVGSLLTANTPYYVEAIDGPLEGERFDVDTAATINSGNNTVVLVVSSDNNTTALSAAAAVNSKFALRKHITVSQVQSFFANSLVGSNQSANADEIVVLNSDGSDFVSYYLRANGTEWRIAGATTVANNIVIPPGSGIFFKKMNSAGTIVMVGSVRTNDFALPLRSGLSLKASGYPVSYSPQAFGGSAANGWVGANQVANADQLQVLNATGDDYISYYLRSNGTEWRISGETTVVTTNQVLGFNDAFMVYRSSADANYGFGVPFTL